MVLGWIESGLMTSAVALLAGGLLSKFRTYRSLLWGTAMLVFITALFPRPGNGLGEYLFAAAPAGLHLPIQLIGVAWWLLGAWLVKSVLDVILRKTMFPHDNQPHARRLFADLASALIYIIAFVGIIETVLKQPISAILATSGVLAIVLGLALQNTLADVFAGLALNVEHPFRAGDWITIDDVEGEVMEINWRATRIRSRANDLIMIPNSVIAKAIVKNHRRLNSPHVITICIAIDHHIAPARVIDALQSAAKASLGISTHTPPTAYACRFEGATVAYELHVGIDEFAALAEVQSTVIRNTADILNGKNIPIGPLPDAGVGIPIAPCVPEPARLALSAR